MSAKTNNAAALAYLKGRGISELTARVYRIEDSEFDGRAAIKYPTVGLAGTTAYRHKFTDGQRPKVKWDTVLAKQPGHLYYSPGGLKDAIAKASGLLYWLSGEPDVWALHTAFNDSDDERGTGDKPLNASCVFGEGSIPETLADDLALLGVTHILAFPDQDDTGLRAAAKLRRLLASVDMPLFFVALPDAKDINALWMADRAEFWKHWRSPRFIDGALLDQYDHERPHEPTNQPALKLHDDLPQGFYDAIERALNISSYKSDGWSKPIACVLNNHEHDKDTPSAGWNRERKIYSCFKCGISDMLAKDIGAVLGLDWKDYAEPRPRPALERPTPPPAVNGNGSAAPVDAALDSAFEQRRQRLVHHGTKMASRYMGLVTGDASGQGEPVVFPYRCFHDIGGLCRIIPSGMAVGVLGASGEGKTSFTEGGIDALNRMGIDVGIWGAEWTPDYFMARRVQRYGGPTFADMIDFQLWQKEAELRIAPEHRQGRALSLDVQKQAVQIAMDIEGWPGEAMCFYDDDPDGDYLYLEELLDHIGATIRIERKNGRRLNMIVFDYAQLAELRQRVENGNAIEHVIGKIKNHAMKHQYVAWITTQAVKASSKLVRKASSDVLTGDDALYVRDDKFNLFLTLKRHYDTDLSLPEGEQQVPTEFVKVYIAKNSVAASRQIVPMQVDWTRMCWLDRKVETRRIDLEELNDERNRKGNSTW